MDLKNQNRADVQGNTSAIETGKYEAFREFLNQIYWDGYAEQLASENPTGFQSEYAGFTTNYYL